MCIRFCFEPRVLGLFLQDQFGESVAIICAAVDDSVHKRIVPGVGNLEERMQTQLPGQPARSSHGRNTSMSAAARAKSPPRAGSKASTSGAGAAAENKSNQRGLFLFDKKPAKKRVLRTFG